MGMLNRDELLTKEVLEIRKVVLAKESEEGAGDEEFVYVREMYAAEKNAFEESIMEWVDDPETGELVKERKLEHLRAKLACCTVCKEDGENLMTMADVAGLSNAISARKLSLIADVAGEMNAMNAKDNEKLLKNSDADLSGDSPSD